MMRRTACLAASLALLLAGTGCGTVDTAPAWPIPPDVKIARVNGYPLAYADAGSGDPVVFLHGAWIDYRLYRPASAALAARHRVILPSLRHYYPEVWDGKSEPISFRQQAADIAGLIRSLDLGKVHLVAHSMAGAVGVEVARTSPDLLRSLVLADPSGPLSVLDQETARLRLGNLSGLSKMLRAQLESTGDRAQAAAAGWNAGAGPGAFERFPPQIQRMFADNVGTLAATPDLDPPGLECGEGRRFPMPVLIVHGERSPKFYLDMDAGLRRCRAGLAPSIVVPNAGHNMHVDNPAFFNKTLLEFFAGN